MKTRIFKILLTGLLAISLLASAIPAFATGAETVNLANAMDASYSWSGVWGDQTDNAMGGNNGLNAFDGNTDINGNKWGSASISEDQWIAVEWVAERTITSLKLWQNVGGYGNIIGFQIQYKTSSSDWQTLNTITDDAFDKSIKVTGGQYNGDNPAYLWSTFEYTLDEAITATGIRIYFTRDHISAPCEAVELTELEIYGVATSVFDTSSLVSRAGDATYHWSGTWGDQTVDSMGGNNGMNAFDGNNSNKWGSATIMDGTAQWISVEWAAAKKITAVSLRQSTEGWSNIKGLEIQIKTASSDWQTIETVTVDDFNRDTKITWGRYNNDNPGYIWDSHTYILEEVLSATGLRIFITKDNVEAPCEAVELCEVSVFGILYVGGTGDTGNKYYSDSLAKIDLSSATACEATTETFPARNAIDGNIDTKWGTAQGVLPQSVVIALPESQNIAGFIINQDHAWSDVTAMNVEAYVNGQWIKVFELPAGERLVWEYTGLFETLINTDALRFNFTAVGNNCDRDGGGAATTSVDIKELGLYTATVDNSVEEAKSAAKDALKAAYDAKIASLTTNEAKEKAQTTFNSAISAVEAAESVDAINAAKDAGLSSLKSIVDNTATSDVTTMTVLVAIVFMGAIVIVKRKANA